MNQSILVIGSLNMDRITHVDHIPEVGETIMGSDMTFSCGGKGANQAYACGKLGGNISMMGAVGTDEAGSRMLANLKEVSVDISPILRTDQAETGTALINVDKKGNNNIVVIPGANHVCSKKYVMDHEKLISNCDILLLQMEVPLKAVEAAIEIAHRYGKKIILNPAPAPDQINNNMLSKADFLIPNETELGIISRSEVRTPEDVRKACRKLLDQGVKQIVVTMGSKGALYTDGESFRRFEAYKVEAVDTTAAGDTFCGALAVKLAENAGIEEAIRFANKAAALSVKKVGAQASIPGRDEVEAFRE